MTDRLDELLAELSIDPCPEDLTVRIQARLAQIRRRSRRMRHAFYLISVAVSVVSLWLISFRAEALLQTIPDLTLDTFETWLSALVRSPEETLFNLSGTAITWVSEITSTLDIKIVFVLGILTASALYGVITLLSNGASREEMMA